MSSSVTDSINSIKETLGDGVTAVTDALGQASAALTAGNQAGAVESLETAKTALTEVMVQNHGVLYQVAAINWLHFCIMLFIFCIAVIIAVSLVTKAPTAEQMKYTYYGATAEEKEATRKSWNGWDLFHTAVVMGIVIAFYWYFW